MQCYFYLISATHYNINVLVIKKLGKEVRIFGSRRFYVVGQNSY